MPAHSDPDDLAIRALHATDGPIGGTGDPGDAHLARCADCQRRLSELRAVVATAQTLQPEDQPAQPPPAVWEAVVAELGLTVTPSALADGAAPPDVPAVSAVPDVARRRPLRHLAVRPLALAAAALLGLVVGVGATFLAVRDDGVAIVSSTDLRRLSDGQQIGDAEILRAGSGRLLELDVLGLPATSGGFYQVWLLDRSGQRLVAVGLLDGTKARFTVPPDLDVTDYSVVDVSLEPNDGNPAHSGVSVVRGTLTRR